MVRSPHSLSWEAFNEHLEKKCLERRGRRLRGHADTIDKRFERDRRAFLPLLAAPYEACDKHPTRATSLSLVRYQTRLSELALLDRERRATEWRIKAAKFPVTNI